MSDVREVLLRLKRRMGKERARELRMYNHEIAKGSAWSPNEDRSWYQYNIWSLAMGMLDLELRKMEKTLPPRAKRRAQAGDER